MVRFKIVLRVHLQVSESILLTMVDELYTIIIICLGPRSNPMAYAIGLQPKLNVNTKRYWVHSSTVVLSVRYRLVKSFFSMSYYCYWS